MTPDASPLGPASAGDAYENARGAALLALRDAGGTLYDWAVQLALRGPWKAEADAAPVGTVMNVNRERLLATGNPHILVVLEAYDALYAAYCALQGKGEGE